jgi:hypothetical protein
VCVCVQQRLHGTRVKLVKAPCKMGQGLSYRYKEGLRGLDIFAMSSCVQSNTGCISVCRLKGGGDRSTDDVRPGSTIDTSPKWPKGLFRYY